MMMLTATHRSKRAVRSELRFRRDSHEAISERGTGRQQDGSVHVAGPADTSFIA